MAGSVEQSGKPHHTYQRHLAVWGRLLVTSFILLAQLFVFVAVIVLGSETASWVSVGSLLISLAVLLFILNSTMQIEYKLAWAIPILLAPLLGGAFYLLFGSRTGTRRQMARYRAMQSLAARAQAAVPGIAWVRARDAVPELEAKPDNAPAVVVQPDAARQVSFLASSGPFVAYQDTETTYYPVGEQAFTAMLEALEGAQHWIAMEYFIVSDGKMWRQIFDVLSRKAAEGVSVWFMYDDVGSFWHLPPRFIKTLTQAGIRVQPVNRLGPGFTLRYNNRDHRKLTVVDGLVGFTGGINIADEYINEINRFGHWKDTVIRFRGAGAWGLATLFFTVWDLVTAEHTDLALLRPCPQEVAAQPTGPGLVVSYDDTPFDDVSLGWAAYRNLMNRADHRLDLMTPYLVPTSEMTSVFTSLAASGVQVRIITPGIPDKPAVYAVTRSHYRALIEAGVEVYEYTPGFLHAKQMIADEEVAIIGTINFDFRSFYLHQENAVWMYRTSAIVDMVTDFEATVAKSRRVTLADVRSIPAWRRAILMVLRTFSPLM